MKVAIVGGGISGLYLAWKLSKKGHSVTVFEKKEKIGKEVCSGLFSERILDFIPQSKNLIQNQIEYGLVHWAENRLQSERTLKVKFSKRFFVMNHKQLDRLTASLAKKGGAEIILKSPWIRSNFTTFQKDFERIIGCDGALSEVRRSLKLKDPRFRLGIQGFISLNNFSNFVETWLTRNGFIWKIPRGKEIEYGIIENPKKAKPIFEKFLKKKNLKLERINSAPIPQGLVIPSNPKITLCGDASSLTKPWSGGGVMWGLLAANLLLKNFPDFLKYKNNVKKFFLPKIIFSKIIYFLGTKIPWILPKSIEIEGDFLI